MADAIGAVAVEEIVKRLISLGIDEIALVRGVKEEVEKLQTVLTHIQLVLQDAEKRQVEDERVRLWLEKLKEAALDAEDILEEFAYDGLRREVVAKRKVRKFFSCLSTIALQSKTAHSIQNICKRLQDIDKEKDSFRFKEMNSENVPSSIISARDTTSLVDESDVFGREDDKLKIVDMLIHGSGSNHPGSSTGTTPPTLSIIAIVGLGGLGKTTLAQLVFNDPSVKEHFGSMMIWVCVSEDFAITTIWSKILKEIGSSNQPESSSKQELQKNLEKQLSMKKFLKEIGSSNQPESSIKQELQKNLEKQLNMKKFLLVLDDFWQKDLKKWEELILPLRLYGGEGSKIIVTTRDATVASTIRAQHKYDLEILSDDQCWSLFESRAFVQGGPERTPNLVEIGKEIVGKCKGLPLAVKVLGGLMSSKTTEKEWLAIRDGAVWESSTDVQKQVMEILKLSYNNLPPSVRQCFSYCSIFPKDYVIQKQEVIQLWMAQGFLKTYNKGELMEEVGEEFIRILCMISFFEKMNEDLTYYKMHDLVHDLAQYLSRSECGAVVDANEEKINEHLRHLSFISSEEPIEIPKCIDKVKKLRTFYFNGESYNLSKVMTSLSKLLQLRLLRVLDLSQLPLRELPSSIGGLKLLKYLNLAGARIKRLPSSIINLYNLQTLYLSGCYELSELPKSVETLTQLRHFYIYRISNNHETPRGLNKLHFLQTLEILKLCPGSASEHIAELEHLKYLGGTLELQNLGNVNNVEAAKKASLMGKGNLCTLYMDWKSVAQGNNVSHDDKLLEALQPHGNLKELAILNFQGTGLPWWMTNVSALPNLIKLRLANCNKCTQIRSLGELNSLKELEIQWMASLSSIGDDHHIQQAAESSTRDREPDAAAILYPCLEKLLIDDVPNLEEWFENNANCFPKLEELELRRCPKLRNMPNLFPSLQELTIVNVKSTDFVKSITDHITSLTSLSLMGSFECEASSSSSSSEKEEEEVARMLGKNKLLESLTVGGFSLMRCMPDLSGLQFLRYLDISDCEGLETCPHFSPSLERLEISRCPALKIEAARLPCLTLLTIRHIKAFIVDDTRWSNKLSYLDISRVPEFEKLPLDFLQSNMHLRTIRITSCSQFQGFISSNEEQVGSSPSSSSWCLESLWLEDCPSILRLELQGFTQLPDLTVYGCTGLQSLEGLQFLRSIEVLSIGPFSEELDDFPFLDALEMDHSISSLRFLTIYGWPCLKSLPEQIQHLSGLESLSISDFDGVTDLPDWLGRLTSLQTLEISNCKNLMHLPSANEMRKLTSLGEFKISFCPLLEERCKRKKRCGLGSGSEWHKISHIPEVSFESSDSSDSENVFDGILLILSA